MMTASPRSHAQISFNFIYLDPPGIGFNAPGLVGENRRTALEETGALLASYFPAYSATIDIDVDGSETDDSTLAAAGSFFESDPALFCDPGFNRGDVGLKILGAADPAPNLADGIVYVNFEDIPWDLDDDVDATLYDFKSTLLHELMHAMGFAHSVAESGSDPCGNAPPLAGGWAPFDEHLGDTGEKFVGAGFVINLGAWNAASTGGAGNAGALWRGANAIAAYGAAPVPLYTPFAFSPGSSISHLDDDFFVSTDFLMEAFADVGPGIRTLSPIELGMMQDIGFATAAPLDLIFVSGFESGVE